MLAERMCIWAFHFINLILVLVLFSRTECLQVLSSFGALLSRDNSRECHCSCGYSIIPPLALLPFHVLAFYSGVVLAQHNSTLQAEVWFGVTGQRKKYFEGITQVRAPAVTDTHVISSLHASSGSAIRKFSSYLRCCFISAPLGMQWM